MPDPAGNDLALAYSRAVRNCEVLGAEGIGRLAAPLHGGFSDVQVAARGGDHQGVAATGARTDIEVVDPFRVSGDRLVEHRAPMDDPTLPKQIGAVAA